MSVSCQQRKCHSRSTLGSGHHATIPLGLFRANSGPEEFRSSAKMAFSALSPNNFSSKERLGCSEIFGLSVAWRAASALGRPSSFEKLENALLRLLGCAKVVTIDHIGATEILPGKPVQMFAVPAMRGVSKYVPLNGRARVLRRLKLRNTFIRRRLGILVAHQYQDGTINTVLNDFVWRGSLGFDRKQGGCTGRPQYMPRFLAELIARCCCWRGARPSRPRKIRHVPPAVCR